MRTIKECLELADRKAVLGKLAYRFIEDTIHLLELKDRTVGEIMERYSKYMDSFIETLLTIEEKRNDDMVFYLHSDYGKETVLDLISLKAIRAEINSPGHDFGFPDWSESLGYLVADTKQTQDDLPTLVALYLEEASFFGTDPDERKEKIDKVIADLDRSMESIDGTEYLTAEEVFDDLRRKHGLPVPEHDPMQEEMESKARKSIFEYNTYSKTRERKRILESTAK
ncbi:MAG: hypothetical protein IJ123_03865 [Blautia sp.]|nr:hypothetical protein [Blautia sp.]